MIKYISILVLALTLFTPEVFAAKSTAPVPPSLQSNVTKIDSFRSDTYKAITATRINTQKEIDYLSSKSKRNSAPVKPLDKTELPIAYIKLFLLSITSFIFSTAVVFYIIFALILFVIVRYFYRKIRNR